MPKMIFVTSQQITDAVRLLNKYGHLSDKSVMTSALNALLDGQHCLLVKDAEAAGMKLKNNMMERLPLTETEKLLADRLLWLRNHYDVNRANWEMKKAVLKDIDAVLAKVGLGDPPKSTADDEE